MARTEFTDEWRCDAPLDQVEKRLDAFRMRIGMRETSADGPAHEYKMGSQVATRLIGGWIGNKRWLPTRASVLLEADGDSTRVGATIEEAMGFGVLDRKLRRKYEQQFATWMEDLHAALQG